MSRSVDLFIGGAATLEEVAAAVGGLPDATVTADPERRRWLLQVGDVRAVLGQHPYLDDGDLPFSQYPYALSVRTGDDTRPQDSAGTALLRRVAQHIQGGLTWPVLLVLDLQYRDPGPTRSNGAGPAGPAGPAAAGTSPAGSAAAATSPVGTSPVGAATVGTGSAGTSLVGAAATGTGPAETATGGTSPAAGDRADTGPAGAGPGATRPGGGRS
jgi:hypothetical protein